MTLPTDGAAASTTLPMGSRRTLLLAGRAPLWARWLLLGVVLCVPYLVLPPDAQSVLYVGMALAVPFVVAFGIRRYRPATRAWILVGAGAGCMAVGEIIWIVSAEDGISGLADAFYLLGYLLLIAAMVGFSHRHSSGIGSLLDASILTAAAASIMWMLVIGPTLGDPARAPVEALVAAAYPIADIVMIGLLLRILLDRHGSNAALLLFAIGTGTFLVSDLVFSVLVVQQAYVVGPVDFGWMIGYSLWGAAALHPSMAAAVVRAPADGRISNARLGVLATVSLVPLLIAVAEQMRQGAVEPMPAIIASAVMFVLVVARLTGVVHTQRGLIDERTRMQGALERLSVEDALTGLSNRRGFNARLADALVRGPDQVAVLCLDLDDFKNINDSLGHPTGDAVLATIAHRLRNSVRARDTVARLGGDEFAVLMTDCVGAEPATALATRIRIAIEQPIVVEGTSVRASASFGVAVSGPDRADAMSLMRDADVALYRAKARSDRPIEVYDEDLHREALRTMVIRNDIAWATDRGQLLLDFQPIIDLETSRTISFEALLRWQHPDLGLLGPYDFLPIAEAGGHLVDIGRWVIGEACHAAATWQALGHAIAVNVNLAPSQLRDPALSTDIRAALDKAGLAPRWLVLEVTESVLDLAHDVRTRLEELRTWGVGLSIDDFGTGYSSLARVGELPVRELKIDRSLLAGEQRMLVAVLQFGTSLGLRVVMEGVETSRQLDTVRRLGFSAAQGYVLAPPMPAGAVEAWLARTTDRPGAQSRMRLASATRPV
jgi:diguanylate cyclase